MERLISLKKEIEFIILYDSYNNGYNSTLGGDGNNGIIMSEELKYWCVRDHKLFWTLSMSQVKQLFIGIQFWRKYLSKAI